MMVRRYLWNSKNRKFKQHLADENWKSLCKAENSSVCRIDTKSDDPHSTKRICKTCVRLEGKSQKKKKRPTKKRDHFLKSREWIAIRYEALSRSSGLCECCGRGKPDGVILQVDHIKPRYEYPHLALELSNLQILCAACNMGKGWKDETDWREPDVRKLMGEKMG